MRRHRERRRRVFWAAMLLGLVMLVAVLSVVDAGLRTYDHLLAASRDRPSKRKETTMFRATSFAVSSSHARRILGTTDHTNSFALLRGN